LLPILILATCLLLLGIESADAAQYKVTITNLTKAQVITPPLVYTHEKSWMAFEPGKIARPKLAELAESGNPAPLADEFKTKERVMDVQTGSGPIPPGHSATLTVEAEGWFMNLTALGMLAQTNDAFFAVQGVSLPEWGEITVWAPAYDAGSEPNNEHAIYVPGPPFGGQAGDNRVSDGAEGFVHIHPGIHGVGDLSAETYDWRNPVAKIVITKM